MKLPKKQGKEPKKNKNKQKNQQEEVKKTCPVCDGELIPTAGGTHFYCAKNKGYHGEDNILDSCPLLGICFSIEDYDNLRWQKHVPQSDEEVSRLVFAN